MDTTPPLLLERARQALRDRQRSPRTEEVYLQWIRRFVRFHGTRHPRELGVGEVRAFLSNLSARGQVAESTESQALAALQFLYREVLGVPLDRGGAHPGGTPLPGRRRGGGRRRSALRPSGETPPLMATLPSGNPGCATSASRDGTVGPLRVPLVLGEEEVRRLVEALLPPHRAVALLLYHGGLRLGEALRLRVADLDPEGGRLLVRHPSGGGRITLYPVAAREAVEEHLRRLQRRHLRDLGRGAGRVPVWGADARSGPGVSAEWGDQWVFPSARIHWDPETGAGLRRPLHHTAVQRAMQQAVQRTRLSRRVSCRTLRDSFAARLLERGEDIRVVQELLGHRSVRTTMVYAPIPVRPGGGRRGRERDPTPIG